MTSERNRSHRNSPPLLMSSACSFAWSDSFPFGRVRWQRNRRARPAFAGPLRVRLSRRLCGRTRPGRCSASAGQAGRDWGARGDHRMATASTQAALGRVVKAGLRLFDPGTVVTSEHPRLPPRLSTHPRACVHRSRLRREGARAGGDGALSAGGLHRPHRRHRHRYPRHYCH
jgi:hypothetical protein